MENFLLDIIMSQMPHKFQNGRNTKIIMGVYIKQINLLVDVFNKLKLCFNLDNATGNQLDVIGSNFLVYRGNLTDEQYRKSIHLALDVFRASGSIARINQILKVQFPQSASILQELGEANVALEENRGSSTGDNIISQAVEILNFTKPLGVGFAIQTYLNINLIDTYDTLKEIELNRYHDRYYNKEKLMNNDYFLYDVGEYSFSVDSYIGVKMEVANE